jgi:hypothetical protein
MLAQIVSVREGESFITLMPCDSQRISVGINYQEVAPVVGAQWASWSPADTAFDHFRWSIAAARPFHPSGEVSPPPSWFCLVAAEMGAKKVKTGEGWGAQIHTLASVRWLRQRNVMCSP